MHHTNPTNPRRSTTETENEDIEYGSWYLFLAAICSKERIPFLGTIAKFVNGRILQGISIIYSKNCVFLENRLFRFNLYITLLEAVGFMFCIFTFFGNKLIFLQTLASSHASYLAYSLENHSYVWANVIVRFSEYNIGKNKQLF